MKALTHEFMDVIGLLDEVQAEAAGALKLTEETALLNEHQKNDLIAKMEPVYNQTITDLSVVIEAVIDEEDMKTIIDFYTIGSGNKISIAFESANHDFEKVHKSYQETIFNVISEFLGEVEKDNVKNSENNSGV